MLRPHPLNVMLSLKTIVVKLVNLKTKSYAKNYQCQIHPKEWCYYVFECYIYGITSLLLLVIYWPIERRHEDTDSVMHARQEIVLSTVNRPFCELTCRAWLCPISIKYLTCIIFYDCYGTCCWFLSHSLNIVLKRRLEIAKSILITFSWKRPWDWGVHLRPRKLFVYLNSHVFVIYVNKWICYAFTCVGIQVIVYVFKSK